MSFADSDLPDPYKDVDLRDLPVRPLTREEAQALIARNPSLPVWRVLAVQAAFGFGVALVWGGLSRSLPSLLSALYGVAVVMLPSLLMARGVFGRNAGRSVGGLLGWQFLKMGLSAAMLVLAPRVLNPVDWVALLVTLVLCLKITWVVLLIGQRRKKNFA
ncbi:MAG: ATP synthase subunit I [Aquabacterium sp.]